MKVVMETIAPDVHLLRFPLPVFGFDINRNVTVIRLSSGEVVVHSTAPFSENDVAQIHAIGPVRWITDPMLDHDTFSQRGCEAFPQASFLAPPGFPGAGELGAQSLLPAPDAWAGELEVLPINGAPGFGEQVIYHVPSRTLVVCDLLMNFPDPQPLLARALMRLALGPERAPGTSRRLKAAIRDREAFRKSLRRVMEWDFETVVVGHGDPLRDNARERTRQAFTAAGWL